MTSLPRFVAKRFLHGLLVFWVSVTAIFAMRKAIPGDIVVMMTPPDTTPAVRNAIRDDLGLNRPMFVQYLDYVGSLLQGDLGYSHFTSTEVEALILPRLLPTVEVAFMAMLVAVTFAIPFGIISARNRNSKTDLGVTLGSLLGVSTPNFWLGLVLVLVVSVWADLLPVARRPVGLGMALQMLLTEGTVSGLVTWLRHIILPAVTLGTYYMALLTRLTRGGMLDELGQLYITVAEAKGLPTVLREYKYALKNTLIPLITIITVNIGGLLNGSLIVEAVFNWPGLGNLFLSSINLQDWPTVQALLILVAGAYVGMNALADVLYTYVDPQVELQ